MAPDHGPDQDVLSMAGLGDAGALALAEVGYAPQLWTPGSSATRRFRRPQETSRGAETRGAETGAQLVCLSAGEAAAISLARQVRASRLIIDEYRGRKAATERGLPVIGTIGVLEVAAEMGRIELEQAFEEVKQTDFWLAPGFLEERLTRFTGRKRSEAAGQG